ncbi:kynureninase [Simiduia aestuariiviva]|uniref:Kynureninase n=1 Tax=Simiduia aestuariiviva TaxID=1510459 RepID=A0A839URR9_9GAMM|nr:kynureninase [Simiduia aestuariiviva]MBB3168566.1 kynureninase [Simiduia aestuariiviva]
MSKSEVIPADIKRLDAEDPLAEKRAEFYLPPSVVYLDGNSLGPMPIAARARARSVVEREWADDLITSWNVNRWIELPTIVGDKIGRLIGADSGKVICGDSTSVNLFKVLAAALSLQPKRFKVLSQRGNFPTDLYMVQGLAALLGESRCQLLTASADDLLDQLDESIAVLLLTQVDFRTGKIHDIRKITELAHEKGIVVIWDLAHSAGVIPLWLDDWQVDFAVGCGYKFLNGGPGAPAFLYVAKRHQGACQQPLSGWMGHRQPFEFSDDYHAHASVKQFLCGTPGVLGMSVLDAALSVFEGVQIQALRKKSLALIQLCRHLVSERPALSELQLLTPEEPEQSGSQLAYAHSEAYAICQALIARGVIADFRAPNILRLGFSPLFLRFEDIYLSVLALDEIVAERQYLSPRFQARQAVT